MTIWQLRLASPDVRYPLPVHGEADWRRGVATVVVPLPPVPASHVIAASFACTDAEAPFSFRLSARGGWRWLHRFETARFGHDTRQRERRRGRGVAVPVDYFETTADLPAPVLTLLCEAPPPRDYLLVVSIRPKAIDVPAEPPAPMPEVAATALSQRALPSPLRESACGPTATAMALGLETTEALATFAAAARHPPTGLYGAWPQNLWAAARYGRLAGLELATDWQIAQRALAAGTPVVASIRFAAGALSGAPMAATGGHLVLLRGIDGDEVIVNDPAAPPDAVPRRYSAAEFAKAWLRWRGAAYVFAAAAR